MNPWPTRIPPLILWAARELLRRPGRHLLLFAALAAVSAGSALPLLLTSGLAHSAAQVLAASPSLVLRRVQPGGWRPIEADSASAHARAVPGVLSARPRVWGLASCQNRAVTVLGFDLEQAARLASLGFSSEPPASGTALIGPGVAALPGARLTLRSAEEMHVTVAARLPDSTGIMAHDLILLPLADARRLLGLAPHEASDLAIEVHHPAEELALPPDLAAAMPWPVRITGRTEALAALEGGLIRRGGLGFMVTLPAVLTLLLLVLNAAQQQAGRWELGLLKALGWSSGDILRRHLWQGLLLGLPAIMTGLALAQFLASGPGGAPVAGWLLDWPGTAPRLRLDAGAALAPLGLLTATILLPWLAALVLPVLLTAGEPLRLLRGELGDQTTDEAASAPPDNAQDNDAQPPPGRLAACDLSLRCAAEGESRQILDRVSLTAEGGSPLLITGATGEGKSSLLHILAGLHRPRSGQVWADGAPVSRWLAGHRDQWRRRAGIVFQQPLLLPDLSALENVILPLLPRTDRISSPRRQAETALGLCRMAHAAARPARLLSGGESQRVALARALVVEPDWLFLDEPTAHQDADGVAVVLDCLRRAALRGAAVIVVSHDPRLADCPFFVRRYHLAGGCLMPQT